MVEEKGRECCGLHVEMEGRVLDEAERIEDGDEDVEGEER